MSDKYDNPKGFIPELISIEKSKLDKYNKYVSDLEKREIKERISNQTLKEQIRILEKEIKRLKLIIKKYEESNNTIMLYKY